MFHASIWGACSFVRGAKPPVATELPRGYPGNSARKKTLRKFAAVLWLKVWWWTRCNMDYQFLVL